jgi:CHAD domain-containing protein
MKHSFQLKKRTFLKKYEKILYSFNQKLQDYILEPNDENIHDIRVAVRRLETAYQIFPKIVRKKSLLRDYVKKAKELFRLNALIRDYDIICARMESKNRDKTHDLVSNLKGFRIKNLQVANKLALKISHLQPPKSTEIALKESRLNKRYLKVLNEIELNIQKNILIALGDEKKVEELHMLRKDIKKLRYSLELASNEKNANNLLKNLKNIQDILGGIRDGDIIMDYLRTLGQNPIILDLIKSEILERKEKYQKFVLLYNKREPIKGRTIGL